MVNIFTNSTFIRQIRESIKTLKIPLCHQNMAVGHFSAGYFSARHFRAGHFRAGTFPRQDISTQGHFRAKTFQRRDISAPRHFSANYIDFNH